MKDKVPVYPSREKFETRIYSKYNLLVAEVVSTGIDDDHYADACLICHLLNKHYGVKPTHYYPEPGEKDENR